MEQAGLTTPIVRGIWIQRRVRNRLLGVAWGALAVFSVGAAFVPFANPNLGLAARVGGILLMLPVAAGFARLAKGYARGGVMVTDTGEVLIQGPWTLKRFLASEVARFEAGLHPAPRGHPGPGVVMVLHDGSKVPIYALGSEGFFWNNPRHLLRWEEPASRLTALLRD